MPSEVAGAVRYLLHMLLTYLLTACSGPGPVLDPGVSAGSQTDKSHCPDPSPGWAGGVCLCWEGEGNRTSKYAQCQLVISQLAGAWGRGRWVGGWGTPGKVGLEWFALQSLELPGTRLSIHIPHRMSLKWLGAQREFARRSQGCAQTCRRPRRGAG